MINTYSVESGSLLLAIYRDPYNLVSLELNYDLLTVQAITHYLSVLPLALKVGLE